MTQRRTEARDQSLMMNGVRLGFLGSLLVFTTALSAQARAQTIEVGTATGAPGQQVTVAMTLRTGGTMIAGSQNDITFAAPIAIAAKANGKPDCAVNPDIDKGATSYAFRPNGCTGAACTSLRALVLSTSNVDPIRDGSVLYTCKVNISSGAANGQYPLTISGIILEDPDGNQIPGATGVNGQIIVTGVPATQTPSYATPTRTPTPQVSINVGSASGSRGQQTTFGVTLQTGTTTVAGTENDIVFDGGIIPIATNASGQPDCVVNPAIDKEATSFAFRPTGCSGMACTSIRAIVFSAFNTDPIPDGSVIYTCKVNISTNAPFVTYPLTISRPIASDPFGNRIAATGTNGSITVSRFAPTNTPTPTATPVRPVIVLGSTMAPPGNQQADFGVFLNAMGYQVAAAQVDIIFDPSTPIGAKPDGSPLCTVNPNINKGSTSFHFQPANCVPGVNCGAVRAVVIAFDNTNPIPDGATLFTCTDAIARTALVQPYVLTCSGAQATNSSAHSLPATCTNGSITVTTPCVGDCNGDGAVTIDELLTGVGIDLGSLPYAQCPAFDVDRNQSLTIDELLQGVLDALDGCTGQQ